MNAIFSRCGLIFTRFHLWTQAVVAFSLVRPPSQWDGNSKGRFAYACMMERRNPLVVSIFTKLLRSELGVSAETNLWLAKIAWTLGRMKLAALIYRKTKHLDATSSIVASCQQKFAEDLLDQNLTTRFAQSIDALALPDPASGPLVLAPVSSRYFDLFHLWSEQLDRNFSGHRLLLALDSETASRLRHNEHTTVLDLSAYFVFHEGNIIDRYARSNLWILRVLILRELAARGYSVLSLDLDALVVGNLAELIESLPSCDIVVQEDYSIPMDVARRHGFILCCGFMFLRSNPATITFLDRYAGQTILEMDDQLAINHLLAESGIAHGVRNQRFMQFNSAGVSWVCPNKSLVSRDIRYGSIIRHFQQVGQNINELREAIGVPESVKNS